MILGTNYQESVFEINFIEESRSQLKKELSIIIGNSLDVGLRGTIDSLRGSHVSLFDRLDGSLREKFVELDIWC